MSDLDWTGLVGDVREALGATQGESTPEAATRVATELKDLEASYELAVTELKELRAVVHEFRRELGETMQAIGDPAIHAAGDLLTDQLRAIRTAFLEQREQLNQQRGEAGAALYEKFLEQRGQLEELQARQRREPAEVLAIMVSLLAVAKWAARKAPGDEGLSNAIAQLEAAIATTSARVAEDVADEFAHRTAMIEHEASHG